MVKTKLRMETPRATIENDIDHNFLKKAIEEKRLLRDSISYVSQTVLKNLYMISDGKLQTAVFILFETHLDNYVRSIDYHIGCFISDESVLLFQVSN